MITKRGSFFFPRRNAHSFDDLLNARHLPLAFDLPPLPTISENITSPSSRMGFAAAMFLQPVQLKQQQQQQQQKSSLLVFSRQRKGKRSIAPVARLFGRSIFEASKLKVLFLGTEEEEEQPGKLPRTYTLTHSDVTSTITLAISATVNSAQALAGVVQQVAEGRGGGGVGGGAGEEVAARALPRQRRPRPAGPDRGAPPQHLPQGAADGAEGVRPRRRRAVRQPPGAGGSRRVGLLPLQPPRVRPRRVLGAAQGSRVIGATVVDAASGVGVTAGGTTAAVGAGVRVLIPSV
ncbi:uncharacterized protein LOC121987938 isoform X1 [Zingiber officinale]|uniref:uncharacterized protein LOC121987938 isoform X1 n=1 Tax=Zingiber officinale TaxID=94328 RepID=UPI001C4AE4A5|nr:uncharacterized protein LOC121987938 isoform X1 [Zingiber officinale]